MRLFNLCLYLRYKKHKRFVEQFVYELSDQWVSIMIEIDNRNRHLTAFNSEFFSFRTEEEENIKKLIDLETKNMQLKAENLRKIVTKYKNKYNL